MLLNTAQPYAIESAGLVCGFLCLPDAMPHSVDAAEALAWLALPPEQTEGFIWLHLNLSQASTERWIREHLSLPEAFHESLHQASRSSRVEQEGDALLAVMNDVLFEFSFEATDISTLWVSLESRLVVSARTRPLRSIDRLRDAVKKGEILRSPVDLMVRLLSLQVKVLEQIVRDAVIEVDNIEDRLLAERLQNRRVNLGALRRVMVRLQRLLAPEPAALFRLLNKPPHWVAEQDVVDLRQSTEEFAAVLNDMSALQERIKLLQEEIAARINEQDNRSLFVLTVVTVLALPFNIIAGLLGMNVGGIPLAQHAHGFWIVVAIVAVFTATVAFFALKRWRS
ncbi:Zinc transport protein ZntB [Amantichitinum ursilacus]|uniref:Zinc transport protein ZntB n=2 Tax=Amantichitinum ursilacus TaxID=857265 RepID=A0A0N0GL77_9NEIS|nr:Zinc transport protein ZntB [Amantichitinum ursilacus]